MSTARSDSGELELVGRELRYAHQDREIWRLAIDELRLIAEYTTEDGPFADDYFYVFADRKTCLFYEAPMCAGLDIIQEIGVALGIAVETRLANSATFKSRVVWPPSLADHPFLSYSAAPRGPGALSYLKDWFLPVVHSEITDEVRGYLEGQTPRDST